MVPALAADPTVAGGGEDAGLAGSAHRPDIPTAVFVEIVRLIIVGLFTAVGFEVAGGGDAAGAVGRPLVGASLGACVGYVHGGMVGRYLKKVMGTFEASIERAPAGGLFAGAVGALLLGGLGALVGGVAVALLPGRWGWPALGLLAWLGVYAGFSTGARKGEELLALLRPAPVPDEAEDLPPAATITVIDSSAAMDGRLTSLVESGFLEGTLAVPRFVLDELQGLADAGDPVRRRRGRRALEVLEHLRGERGVDLCVLADEVPERAEVDAKLVVLAGRLGASLLTVDAALARVAELQGVRVRNPARLAEALTTVLVPGEVIRLSVVKAGREAGQGLGYLEDGTMVVVSGGASLVGDHVEVSITASTPTSRGRMYFAAPVRGPLAAAG